MPCYMTKLINQLINFRLITILEKIIIIIIFEKIESCQQKQPNLGTPSVHKFIFFWLL